MIKYFNSDFGLDGKQTEDVANSTNDWGKHKKSDGEFMKQFYNHCAWCLNARVMKCKAMTIGAQMSKKKNWAAKYN